MEPQRHLKWILNQQPGFTIIHAPELDPAAICAAIGALAQRPVVAVRLASDHMRDEDLADLREALLGDRLLLLVAGNTSELPARLAHTWEKYTDNPEHTDAGGRVFRFTSDDAPRAHGVLGVIVPEGYQGELPDTPYRLYIQKLDELGGKAASSTPCRDLGLPRVHLSIKDLCFLHHRDAEGAEHHSSIPEIMERSQRALSWSDLQRVLQAQPNPSVLEILQHFEKAGRVSSVQMAVAAEAIALLAENRERQRVGSHSLFDSIYHALWWYGPVFENRSYLFRGQRSSRWRQDNTLLRPDSDGAPPSLATLIERLGRTQAFLDALAAQEMAIVGRVLTEDERLAIAQHYGMPTALLDYTRSFQVAAFFATGAGDASRLREGDIGVIYYVLPEQSDAVTRRSQVNDGLDFAVATGLELGSIAAIAPVLPDVENRIARQQGIFIAGFESRDLQRAASGVLYFRQRAGEAFEDARLGITRSRLLPPDSRLQRLADAAAASPTRYSPSLTAARIPSSDLFGALGLQLNVTVSHSQEFLDALAVAAQAVEPGFWHSLRSILDRFFQETHIRARTNEVGVPATLATTGEWQGIEHVLDAVDVALEELAGLADLERDAFRALLWKYRPVLRLSFTAEHDVRKGPPAPPVPGAKVSLALAAGLFIVGLEYVQTVHGEMTREYTRWALSMIHDMAQPPGQ